MGIYDREYSRDEGERAGLASKLPKTAVGWLLAINIVVFLINYLFVSEGQVDWLKQQLLLTPDVLQKPWLWWKFVSYGFDHDGVSHILFNMIGLWSFGTVLEQRYGKSEFLRFYLLSVVFCGVAWAVEYRLFGSFSRLLGASGAVTSVILLFVFLEPKRTVALMFVPMPAWMMGVVLIAMNLFGSQPAEGPKTAYDVHLFGAAFAACYFWFGWNFGRISPPLGMVNKLTQKAQSIAGNRPQLRIHDPEDEEAYREQDEQADRLLAKVHAHGYESLTPQESRILEDYSRRMRQKRR